jgi:hypothetical protein
VPTGSVEFLADGLSLGPSVGLDGDGKAAFHTTQLHVGPHTITARYHPSGSFGPSEGPTSLTVDPADTMTTVTWSVVPAAPFAVYGQVVYVTATVVNTDPNGPAPEGSIDFTGADVALAVPSITVHPGEVFGLGFIRYSVMPGAPGGTVRVPFDALGTSLSDPSGNAIHFTTDAGGGAIRISAVPEPSSLTLVATALLAIAVARGSRGVFMRPAGTRPAGRA